MSEQDINVKFQKYLGRGFNDDQLTEIKLGLEDELNVDYYARTDMPASEMRYLRQDLYQRKQENYKQEIKDKIYEERSNEKKLSEQKSRRELAYIALVMFAISVVAFVVFLIQM